MQAVLTLHGHGGARDHDGDACPSITREVIVFWAAGD